jgi:hypothetical protein
MTRGLRALLKRAKIEQVVQRAMVYAQAPSVR